MSAENNNNKRNSNKKKRNEEKFQKVDEKTLDMLSKSYVFLVNKSANFPRVPYNCRICQKRLESVDQALKHILENNHKRNLKKIETENLLKYLPKSTANQLEVINECINDTLKLDIFISEDESNRRRSLCEQMNIIAEEIGGKLHVCGSMVTGHSLISVSDVNLYFEFSTKAGASYLTQLQELSAKIIEKLKLKTDVKQDKYNSGLFVRDSTGLSYHISSSTNACWLTSECLSVYLKIDRRAETLARLFRYFANQSFIDRDRDGLFPSQVFTIMVVFYLQTLAEAPILPNLHKLADLHPDLPDSAVTVVSVYDTIVRYVSDLDTVKSIWNPPKNELSLAELWLGLLRFYTVDFDSTNFMVSVRCNEPVLKIDRNIVNKRLAVEDPFDFKRNLLFGWNSPDVIDFLNDQMQGCYAYFAVPQLSTGPAFTKVNFSEISLASMEPKCLVTPTFAKDTFTSTIDFLEAEFKKVYEQQIEIYNVKKWPAILFVKSCLSKILTSVFDSKLEIDSFVSLLSFKQFPYFNVPNYASFRDLAVRLAMCVLEDFSAYFEFTDSWSKPSMSTKDAFLIIKKSADKFRKESLNIATNEDDCDEDELELRDNEDENEVDTEGVTDELGMSLDDCFDENDDKPNEEARKHKDSICEIGKQDFWKIPISFQLIHFQINGVLENGGNEPEVYNEHRVQAIPKDQLIYSFLNMKIHKTKLEISCSLCSMKGHRKERCPFAIPRFDELKYVLRDVDRQWLLILKSMLIKKYEHTRSTKDRCSIYEKIFNDINKIIKKIYPNVRSQLFGSSHNGFMTRASDIDICLEFYVQEKRQNLRNKDIVNRLMVIGKELKNCIQRINLTYVLCAKVPIVKFYLYGGIQGDISINNSLGIQNTRMIKVYSDIFPDMKVLGNLIKFVSKSCDIGDASQGTLSSYAYIIMLIHFLQKRNLLPVLQEIYEGSERPSFIVDGWNAWYQSNLAVVYKQWKPSSSPTSLEYLWLDFFYYYTVEFNTDKEVVSIRQEAPLHKIDKGWQSAYMAIEDPFDLNHNLSGCLSLDKCRYILQCFAHVLKMHSCNQNVHISEASLYMLMEPSTLRPGNNIMKTCYQCHQNGHLARECKGMKTETKSQKSDAPVSQELPCLPASFKFKESNNPNRLYLQAEVSDNVQDNSVPIKTINYDINDFSIVPISINLGAKSIVIPMLVDKDGKTFDVLNNMFKNGVQNLCSLPIDIGTVNIKGVARPRRDVTDSATLSNTNNVFRDNSSTQANQPETLRKTFQKSAPSSAENIRAQTEFINRLMTNNGNNNNFYPRPPNMFGPRPNSYQFGSFLNYNGSPNYRYGPPPGQPQRFTYNGYPQGPMNGRHASPNQGAYRYGKANK